MMGTDFKNRLKDGRTENMGVQCEGCDDVFDVEAIGPDGLCEACSLEEAYLPPDPDHDTFGVGEVDEFEARDPAYDSSQEFTFVRDQGL